MKTGQRKLCDVCEARPDAAAWRKLVEAYLASSNIKFQLAHHGTFADEGSFDRYYVSVKDVRRAQAGLAQVFLEMAVSQ
jgi:hypothetical protein